MQPDHRPEVARNAGPDRPRGPRRVLSLAVTSVLAAATLVNVSASGANAQSSDPEPTAYEHSITGCDFLDEDGESINELSVPFDGSATYDMENSGDPLEAGADVGRLWAWLRATLNGVVVPEFGGAGLVSPKSTVEIDGAGTSGSELFEDGVLVLEFWAVSGIDPSLGEGEADAAALFGDPNAPLCTLTLTFLPEDSGEESGDTSTDGVSGNTNTDGGSGNTNTDGGSDDTNNGPGDSGVVPSDSGVVSGGSGVESDDSGMESGYPDLVPTSVPAGEGRGVPSVPLIVVGGLVLLAGAADRRHGEVHFG